MTEAITVTFGATVDDSPEGKRRAREMVEAIKTGRIQVPYRCGHCRSSSILLDEAKDAVFDAAGNPANFECLPCGRRTPIKVARKLRIQELRAVIAGGAD